MRELVEVAVPVPLRTPFTYRLPAELEPHVQLGTRVAVTFNRRKVAGFVVGFPTAAPAEVKKVLSVAGVLEQEPVFPTELLLFLQEAARYYVHPLGEVLRAAAPALPTGALRRLRKGGFLDESEALPGRKVAHKKELFASRTGAPPEKLGASQQLIMDALQGRDEVGLSELRQHTKSARKVLQRLAELGLVTLQEREIFADPFFGSPIESDTPPKLSEAQAHAVAQIGSAFEDASDKAFLLHGVTGSGKTEVYLRIIEMARARGQGALLLVPEIALTPQLVARFRARFGDDIAVLHSALGERARDDAWRRLRRGELRLVVGARSALFAPVDKLGVVVVDEEHDPSFKQEEGFRYQARDMALLRAHRAGAICILGSATPSLESFARAQAGGLRLLSLPERATQQSLPEVEVVDLRRHRQTEDGLTGHPLLSGPLHRSIAETLERGDQTILFLNRRGFSPSVRCMACGEQLACPSCSVPLTEHRAASQMRCHYCDFSRPRPQSCPTCGASELVALGLGTEQLEATLSTVFAPARVARLDRDVATGSNIERVLTKLRRKEIDILVGTQMVTKGHDIPGVTLVGVVLADQSLGFPDFRASERTFQLLAQVAGRAGRGERAGKVLMQTFNPDHPSIRAAAAHDYEQFYRAEMRDRTELGYPPMGRMVAVRTDAGDERRAKAAAELLVGLARRHPAVSEGRVLIQGPAPAPIARLRARYRFRFLMRGEDRRALRQIVHRLVARIDEGLAPARASVDLDPVSML